MSKATRILPLLLTGLLLSASIQAQETYQLQPDSKLWIDGTSNKSDWTVYATELDGQITMDADAVTDVQLAVPSAKVVSNKSTIMDRLMHGALKVEEHPEITYKLTSVAPADGDPTTLQAVGELTLAGVTKPIEMTVKGEQAENGQVRFTGDYTLLMTDYEMQPPSAMFGALRTGDEVTVHFDLLAAPGAMSAQ